MLTGLSSHKGVRILSAIFLKLLTYLDLQYERGIQP